VLFIDASTEFEAGKSQNQLRMSAIRKVASAYWRADDSTLPTRSVSARELRDSSYSLNLGRFFPPPSAGQCVDAQSIAIERRALEKQLRQISTEVDNLVARLGSFEFGGG